LDILEYAFRSSPTVGSGLDQLARYVRAVSDRAGAELDIVGDAVAFTWLKPAQPHRVEFTFALIVRMAREATGTSLAPREVHFAHAGASACEAPIRPSRGSCAAVWTRC